VSSGGTLPCAWLASMSADSSDIALAVAAARVLVAPPNHAALLAADAHLRGVQDSPSGWAWAPSRYSSQPQDALHTPDTRVHTARRRPGGQHVCVPASIRWITCPAAKSKATSRNAAAKRKQVTHTNSSKNFVLQSPCPADGPSATPSSTPPTPSPMWMASASSAPHYSAPRRARQGLAAIARHVSDSRYNPLSRLRGIRHPRFST